VLVLGSLRVPGRASLGEDGAEGPAEVTQVAGAQQLLLGHDAEREEQHWAAGLEVSPNLFQDRLLPCQPPRRAGDGNGGSRGHRLLSEQEAGPQRDGGCLWVLLPIWSTEPT